MREIEVKARLKDKEAFLKKAAEKGVVFDRAVIQDDTTYVSKLPRDDPNWNVFRIRKQGDKIILTMKYGAKSNPLDSYEHETTVGKAEEIVAMLERTGHVLDVRIYKSRQIAHYQELELCVDDVEGLGGFVEVEKLADNNANVEEIQTKFWALLEELGVALEDQVHEGYDTLIEKMLASKA